MRQRIYTAFVREYILHPPENIYLLCQRRYLHQLLKLNRTKQREKFIKKREGMSFLTHLLIPVSKLGRYKKIETQPEPRLYTYLIYNRMIILRLP